ncbi:Coiled-coil domain-containing protein 57 [Apodemus speciosus]|uniref:Coiled-coil domain-containing protein 57 n=1 Tax=Apodemus speciosus TaxID=105296 RepID=A0ABQ0FD63_APOSI
MLPPCSEQELSELLAQKEEEWRALQAHRAQRQEAALQTTQNRLEEAQGKLQRLQEDFVYNLQVLEERDRELERYAVEFTQARRREEAQQAEASELKIEVAKLRQELAREARRSEELQRQHQLMLQEHRLELERAHSDNNSKLDHQREQYENLKWKLERKLKELDGELALQRQAKELLLEFESEMQRREHEFQLRADDMSNVVLTHELKIKLLNKELQALREAGAQATESLQKAETEHIALERELQGRAREVQALEATRDARIKDLERKFHSLHLAKKKAEETFRRKHEELGHQVREKDAALAALKGTHAEQLQALDAKVLELQFQCEALEEQLRRAEWQRAEDAKEKNALTDKFREDAAALKAAWDAQIAQMSKEAVSKDLQVQALQEEEMKLKAQVARFQQDVDRYKQQLSLAVEREQSLKREQVQLGLDWQRRCDDVERDQIQKSETLIQGLTKAREQVAAKLQETERALHKQETLLKAVSLERDQAVETLRTHGLLPGQEAQEPPQQHEGEIRRGVQEQTLTPQLELEDTQPLQRSVQEQTLTPQLELEETQPLQNYVLALEAEMQNLKHKLKALEEQLRGTEEPVKTPMATADPRHDAHSSAEAPEPGCPGTHPVDQADLKLRNPPASASQVLALKYTALADQTSIALALRKLGDRVHLLNLLVTQLRKKLRQKPPEQLAVHREIPSEADQVHLEVLELQKQVAELRKHLKTQPRGEPSSRQQVQREGLADWYPLEGQVESSTFPQEVAQPPQTISVSHLQRKLKDAAKRILSLRLEREQLLEMGNRLRAGQGHAEEKQHRIPTETRKSVYQKENRTPKLPQARDVSEQSDRHSHRSSSLAGSSLQDTWRLLDLGSSLSGTPSQDNSAADGCRAPPGPSCFQKVTRSPVPIQKVTRSPVPIQKVNRSPVPIQKAFAVKGLKMEAQPKATHPRPSKSHPAKPTNCQQQRHPRIRNYNLKD